MTRPDLAYLVHQGDRFCNDPKLLHERAVKRICRYLYGTRDKGLILEPDLSKGFECHVDADWAGTWHTNYAGDTSTALSRTSFIIKYAGCPLVWASKMQTLIALSTTEAVHIALSSALREVITLMNLLKELKSHGIEVPYTQPKVHCKVFEDNAACIELAKTHRMRPRTKHLAVRLHHFREHVLSGDIIIAHVPSKDQQADGMTEPISRLPFQALRKF
jgi:hypothetical protein